MSFVSQLLGGQTNPQAPNVQTLQYSGAGGPQGVLNQAVQGQQTLAQQLQEQAAGGGPNPAAQQLQNAIQKNAASASAIAASQRGINPGLATKNAIDASNNANQEAAGQAAVLGQQQALNAEQQLSGLLGTQVGQTLQASQAPAAIQAGLAQANANNAQQAAGGLFSGIGSALPALLAAEGGKVPKAKAVSYADGSGYIPAFQAPALAGAGGNPFTTNSASNPFGGLKPQAATSAGSTTPQPNSGGGPQSIAGKLVNGLIVKPVSAIGSEFGKMGDDISNLFSPAPSATPGSDLGFGRRTDQINPNAAEGDYAALAKGGKVPAYVSPGERYLPPSEVKKVEKGEKSPMKAGEKIPGKPKVGGASNDYRNDTVFKKLKEGGVVLPRSVTMSKDAEQKAMAFMKALNAKKGK